VKRSCSPLAAFTNAVVEKGQAPFTTWSARDSDFDSRMPDRLSGRWPVQGCSGAYERLEGILIYFIALMDIDSAPDVAFKAGVE
jgi:hypothetical protein